MINDRFDTIYFNGCSFTEGGGFEALKFSLKEAYKEKYGFEYDSEKDVCYPTLVGNKTGIKIVNDGKSGSGADRIIRKAYEYIRKYPKSVVEKTLFMFEVPTAINRLDLFSNKYQMHMVGNVVYNDEYIGIKDAQCAINWIYGPQLDATYRKETTELLIKYSEYFIDVVKWELDVAYKFLGLFSYFELNGIDYYISGDLTYFVNRIKMDKYIPNFLDKHVMQIVINDKIENDIVTMADNNKCKIYHEVGKDISNDGHPGFQAHRLWADGIVNFLNNKYI